LQFPIKRIVIHIKYRLWKKCIVTTCLVGELQGSL
jgi:hypothetical protein